MAEEILAMEVVENLIQTEDRYKHEEKIKEYLELCKELGSEPDPKLLELYQEFKDLYR